MAKLVDTNEMRERLWRNPRRGVGARNPHTKWAQNILVLNSLDKLLQWCRQRKIEVYHESLGGQGGAWFEDDRRIYVEPRLSPSQQVLTLLHECGHALIDESDSKLAKVRFGRGYLIEGKKPSHLERVNLISVELEAWNRGWMLAERLGIPVKQEEFERAKATAVMSYMRWAVSPMAKQNA